MISENFDILDLAEKEQELLEDLKDYLYFAIDYKEETESEEYIKSIKKIIGELRKIRFYDFSMIDELRPEIGFSVNYTAKYKSRILLKNKNLKKGNSQ